MSKEPTCNERIAAQLAGRFTQYQELRERIDNDNDRDNSEQAYDEWLELPLSVETKQLHRIDLSTGGPADWFEVVTSGDDIERITYHFADWFDHAEQNLTGDEFDTAREFLSPFLPENFQ